MGVPECPPVLDDLLPARLQPFGETGFLHGGTEYHTEGEESRVCVEKKTVILITQVTQIIPFVV